MKVIRFDSVGGASGDMILASLIGLGANLERLIAQLKTLQIGDFGISTRTVSQHGLSGLQVTVEVPAEHHAHRHLADIRELIEQSGLSGSVKATSIKVFELLADAEAKVHGTSREEVHFHEVGAMDSIIDIVGSCTALEILDVKAVTVSLLPYGHGTINTAHGMVPNPAPATVELLAGFRTIATDEPFELVTPTAAALFAVWTAATHGAETGVVRSQANSFGQRTLNSRPNLLRAILLESGVSGDNSGETCLVLESNVDDASPELIGALAQKLMAEGALDVFTTAIQMKKQRPGTLLTVLCLPKDRERFIDILFAESTTFGIREHMTSRIMLERRHVEVKTPYGSVRIKIGTWKGRDITRSPEYEDCLRLAREHNVAVRTVYDAASKAD